MGGGGSGQTTRQYQYVFYRTKLTAVTKQKMNFNESPEFKKDVKTLSKKVRTIKSDPNACVALIEQLYVPGGDERLKNIDHCF